MLEDLDRQIVTLLSTDGRMSYTDLGRETGAWARSPGRPAAALAGPRTWADGPPEATLACMRALRDVIG